MRWLYGVLIVLAFSALPAAATEPAVILSADTLQVTLGQPVQLELRLRYGDDVRPDEPDLAFGLLERPGTLVAWRLDTGEVVSSRPLVCNFKLAHLGSRGPRLLGQDRHPQPDPAADLHRLRGGGGCRRARVRHG